MTVAEVPPFQIQERSGRRRTVVLRGRALPYRPFTLKIEQRVKVTFPQGNPEGFGTTMGATEGDTTLTGAWKDKYLGYDTNESPPAILSSPRDGAGKLSTPVTSAVELARIFDSIVAAGQPLEVTWGYVIRRGYLKSFEHKPGTIHDMEWSMEFTWTGRGVEPSSPEFGPAAGLSEAGGGLREMLRRFARALDAPRQLVAPFADELRQSINAINASSLAIDDAANGFLDEVNPATFSNNVASLLGSAATTANNLKDRAEALGSDLFQQYSEYATRLGFSHPETLDAFDRADAAVLDSIDPDALFKARLYQSETIADARRLRDEADARQRVLNVPVDETLGTYRARDGEDLRDVSNRYYGTPSEWRALMLFNNLQGVELYAGQVVAIPRIDARQES